MKLEIIHKHFPNIQELSLLPEEINGLTRSSSDFRPGDIFVAISGTNWDGHNFISQCIGKASLIFLHDENFVEELINKKQSYCLVEDTRECFGVLSNLLAGEPSRELFCVGITGTNGKTTTNYCVEEILNAVGYNTAIMGTVDHHLGAKTWETKLTSPGPEEFYARIKEMKEAGASALSIEMSSHALDQKRNHELALDVAIFTNLTQDHLDYHKSMEEYFSAKKKILEEVLSNSPKDKKLFVYNADDSCSDRFQFDEKIQRISYGFSKSADLKIESLLESYEGLEFYLEYQGQKQKFTSPLVGHFNLYNMAASIAIALFKGKKLSDLVEVVQQIKAVPGRLEKIAIPNGANCFVDFAHSPDALEASLSFLHEIRSKNAQKNKIICVFGAGGDRDKTKRPLMAQAAEKYADQIIVCSDNPRSENPEKIIEDIAGGFSLRTSFEKMEDRKKAIELAISYTTRGDVVLIAGKGHENTQEIKGKKHHFSDQEIVKSYKG